MGTQSVTVSAGTTMNSNIHDTFALDVRILSLPIFMVAMIQRTHRMISDVDSDLERRRLRWDSYWVLECGVSGSACYHCDAIAN